MRAYRFSIAIDRPPEAVWAYLTDLSKAPKWRTMFRSMEVVGGGPLGPGSKLRVVMEGYGKVSERIIETTAFEAPRRWVTHSESGGVSGDFEYAVSPSNGGTTLTTSLELHAHRWLAWLFLPLVARQERRLRTGQLAAFKRACEESTPRA